MKNIKIAYGVLTFVSLGFLFGQFLKTGRIDLTTGGFLIVLFIAPALLDLKVKLK
jgi:hypothetical protein